MKEQFYTLENIDIKAQNIIENINNTLIKPKKQEFIPEKSALVIIDMQNYFCSQNSIPFVPSAPAIIPKVNELVKAFNSKNLPIVYTKQYNLPENAGMMAKWWKYTISPESSDFDIFPELNTTNAYILDKTQYDAFYNSDLENYLKSKGVTQLVITGLLTHLCCESTARAAFVRGYQSFMVVDANVTYKEIFQTSSLLNMAHGVASAVLTKEICEKIKQEK